MNNNRSAYLQSDYQIDSNCLTLGAIGVYMFCLLISSTAFNSIRYKI